MSTFSENSTCQSNSGIMLEFKNTFDLYENFPLERVAQALILIQKREQICIYIRRNQIEMYQSLDEINNQISQLLML